MLSPRARNCRAADPLAAVTWLGRIAQCARLGRPNLHASMLRRSARAHCPGCGSGQLPLGSGSRWCALRSSADPPTGETLSIVAYMPEPLQETRGDFRAGLWLDEWIEVVPGPNVMTGIAFNFGRAGCAGTTSHPACRAARMRARPGTSPPWEAMALETLDLARLRTVDPEILAGP